MSPSPAPSQSSRPCLVKIDLSKITCSQEGYISTDITRTACVLFESAISVHIRNQGFGTSPLAQGRHVFSALQGRNMRLDPQRVQVVCMHDAPSYSTSILANLSSGQD